MIVDCHTHIWSLPQQLGKDAAGFLRRQGGDENLCGDVADHAIAAKYADKTLVLGFVSAYQNAGVPNDFIAEYVSRHSSNMIGIAAVDPTQAGAAHDAQEALGRKEFRGLTISPASQNFHPADSRVMPIYEVACQNKAPLFICQDAHFMPQDMMEYARPFLLDEVAREFPELTIVISSMGQPWIDETISLLGKHERVFADIAGLVRRPWQAYKALVQAHQFNVMDKVLFGSDFPFFTASEAIQSIYRLHEMTKGTALPTVPREMLRSIVERDALTAIGIARPGEVTGSAAGDEEEFKL